MSESDGGPGQREVAYRLFAAEFEDADREYSESDEERAPNYVITPTGARVNRLFVVGVLTEVEPVSDDVLRARVVDPTGAFVLYAGQYQQDERAFLERADPPAFVAVTGKARTFQPEDSDRVFTSVRPESVSEVDADTRDRWTVDAAEQTLDRVETMATAIALGISGDALRDELESRGVEEGLADGVELALDHYDTTPTYLAAVRDLAIDAARLVAGEVEEVAGLDAAPGDAGDVTASDLLSEPVESTHVAGEPEDSTPEPAAETAESTGAEPTDGVGGPDSADDPASAGATSTDAAETAAVDSAAAETGSEPAEGETVSPASTDLDEAGAAAQQTGSIEPADEKADVDTEGPGDFEPGEFDLDDSEREEIESEYGTEFQSGAEVDDPGEADIETPEPDAEVAGDPTAVDAEASDDPDAEATPAPEGHTSDSGAADDETTATEGEPSADVDLVDAVVTAMEELDEGDGAGRDAVVEAVIDRTGADVDAVADAIQDALMDGRCYEPADDTYKPI